MPSLRQLLARHPSLLLIDSSSLRIQVGLWRGGENSVAWRGAETEAGGGVFACAEALLAEAGLRVAEVDAFAFCEGPGSVLGIRTAAVALRTWRVLKTTPDSASAPCYAYQSLDIAARAHAAAHPGAEVNVIADARRDSWHLQKVGAPLRRAPAAELPAGCLMPEGFRHWSALPPGTEKIPYKVDALLASPALVDADVFRPAEEPDAFLHEEPSYVTWTPKVHQAPAS